MRSAKQAIEKCRGYINAGYTWAVDIDLSKYFDTKVSTKWSNDKWGIYEYRRRSTSSFIILQLGVFLQCPYLVVQFIKYGGTCKQIYEKCELFIYSLSDNFQ